MDLGSGQYVEIPWCFWRILDLKREGVLLPRQRVEVVVSGFSQAGAVTGPRRKQRVPLAYLCPYSVASHGPSRGEPGREDRGEGLKLFEEPSTSQT